jgi:hypothetical protein
MLFPIFGDCLPIVFQTFGKINQKNIKNATFNSFAIKKERLDVNL